jgi:uncharacterized membrane protein YkvA (DUF1232 family)
MASRGAGWHSADVNGTVLLAVLAGLIALWLVILAILWALRPRGVATREVVRVVPDIVRLLRTMITDPSVPPDVRVVLVGLVAWILSPIDLIPEFVPILGPLDDVIVAVAALRYVRWRVGLDGIRRRWPGSDDGFALLTRVIGR